MDYTIEFCTLTVDSSWNNSALTDAFLCGLSAKIKDQLISIDIPDSLDSVNPLKHKIDRRYQDRERATANVFPVNI